jgi:hypothetical protein
LQKVLDRALLTPVKTSQTILVAILAAASAFIIIQSNKSAHSQRELAAARAEIDRLRAELSSRQQQPSLVGQNPGQPVDQSGQDKIEALESEVLRLRGTAGRAERAEAEVEQIRLQLDQRKSIPPATVTAGSDSGTNTVLNYLGDAVLPPPNLDRAYTREGLANAIQEAARNAGVRLKKVEIDSSEFPFLAGVVCEQEADFEKLKSQFSQMEAYRYGGSVSSHTTFAFNLVPSSAYPQDAMDRIRHRTMLRQQMFFDQINSDQN